VKLSKVKRLILKRIAYLDAVVEKEPYREWAIDEADALRTLLRCQGMLDEERIEMHHERVSAKVLPAIARVRERAYRHDSLLCEAGELVDAITRAARVA
jgi:hypothetical protein